jgi:hypothetical protein
MSDTLLRTCSLVAAFGLAAPAWSAAVLPPMVDCATLPADSIADSDGDGFTDVQECAGISLDAGLVPTVVPGDPNKKDVFLIVGRPSTGVSLLPANFNPFLPATWYGVSFNGLEALGVNVHVLGTANAASNRTLSKTSTQKAVKITESLDINGTILGNCQWGTPMGLDGCVVYTQRVKNFIDSKCNAAGDTSTNRTEVFMAYITQSFLHEVGHSLGGITSVYNASFGGYHYQPGARLVMEQAVTYATKGGKCTWNISSDWNVTLDPPAVRLK